VLFIREIDLEKSDRILAILSEKEVSRTLGLFIDATQDSAKVRAYAHFKYYSNLQKHVYFKEISI
jgi:hypothetical protein